MDEQSTGRPILLLDYRALEGQCIKALVAASSSICSWAHKQSTERQRSARFKSTSLPSIWGGDHTNIQKKQNECFDKPVVSNGFNPLP